MLENIKQSSIYFEQNQRYISFINQQESLAKIARIDFLNTDFAVQKENNSLIFTWKLKKHYENLILFPDEDVIRKFKELGLKAQQLKWFTPYPELIKEVEKIEVNPSVLIFKEALINGIYFHLTSKMTLDLLHWAGFTAKYKGKTVNKAFKEFVLFYERINYAANNEAKRNRGTTHHAILNVLEQDLKSKISPDINTNEFLALLKGETKDNISMVLNSFYFDTTTLSQSHFLGIVYDLFKILFKDEYSLFSRQEFELSRHGLYGNNYDRYKSSRMKKILQRVNWEINSSANLGS